jgi:hypothetical protein
MSSVLNPLQKAISDKLVGAAGLTALVSTRIYDYVPQAPTFPYVVFGDDTGTDWSTFGRLGEEVTITIHAWSRERGRKETKSIQSQIDAALNRQALTITGYTAVSCVREYQESFQDPDGITYHGVQRFRVFAHE